MSNSGSLVKLAHIAMAKYFCACFTPFESMKDKPPVLFMHGVGNSATSMMSRGYTYGPTISGELANRGYDVYMGSFRGTIYSNSH